MSLFERDLSGAQSGDGRAFEALYRGLHERVQAFARARNSRDPEAIVNETFLQVFRNLPTFYGSEPQFNAWVFKIARNKIIDEKRRAERRPVEVSDGALRSDLAGQDDPARDVVNGMSQAAIEHYLELLTPDQRDVVVLRIVAGLTLTEVAEVLEKPQGAIKSLQRRAFRTIARSLSAQGVSR